MRSHLWEFVKEVSQYMRNLSNKKGVRVTVSRIIESQL